MKNKKVYIFMTVLVFFILAWTVAFADVVHSKHNMYTEGKGTSDDICSYCHAPHNAIGDKIWSDWNKSAMPTGYSPIGNMCYTCHDGTVTSVGSAVFSTSLQQHKVSAGKDCDMCHNVHDNSRGKFMGIVKTKGAKSEKATYCETCHDSTIFSGAEGLGDHTAGSEHPYKDTGALLNDSCNACHVAHGAASYTIGSLTNPILKQVNTDSVYCATCHSAAVQAAKGGSKHPANLSAAGTWGKVTCDVCHDVHQPSQSGRAAVLKKDNTDSSYCKECHKTSADVTKGPKIGGHTHPVDIAVTTAGLTPAAKDIDDDADGVADYPGNTQSLVCETCHSAHSKGVYAPLVRITRSASALCTNCHTTK